MTITDEHEFWQDYGKPPVRGYRKIDDNSYANDTSPLKALPESTLKSIDFQLETQRQTNLALQGMLSLFKDYKKMMSFSTKTKERFYLLVLALLIFVGLKAWKEFSPYLPSFMTVDAEAGEQHALFETTMKKGETVAGLRVTSEFKSSDRPNHKGVDFAAPIGTNLYMLGNTGGKVECLTQKDGSGNIVGWGHYAKLYPEGIGKVFIVGHLNFHCKSGHYKSGKLWGESGNSGTSTGPHIHLEQWGHDAKGHEENPAIGYAHWIITGKPPRDYNASSDYSLALKPWQKAVLDTIAKFEVGRTDVRGYYVLVFEGDVLTQKELAIGHPFSKDLKRSQRGHPFNIDTNKRKMPCNVILGKRVCSTATGRYQVRNIEFNENYKKLGLTDFLPPAQDKMALELLRQNGAVPDFESGNHKAGLQKIKCRWIGLGCDNPKIQQLKAPKARQREVLVYYKNRLAYYQKQ